MSRVSRNSTGLVVGRTVRRAVLLSAVLGATPALAQLRSFGEAEGFGALATGGRGGTTVYHVTNLSDSGAGSFRDAVSGSNRIIVFDVGGVITLKSAVSCSSNLTIAGQTAPGAGIAFDGGEIGFSSHSNIICRYVRFRPGDKTASSQDDCVGMYNTQNAILDHCSLEFAPYDNIDAVTDNGNDCQLTFQNNIVADPIGQQFGAHLEAVNGHITLTKNLFANSHNRNPLAKCNDQFINNIDYNNEASYTTHTSTAFKHDLVNNAFIYGPATGGNTFYQVDGGKDKFYISGNIQDSDKDGILDIDAAGTLTTGASVVAPPTSTTTTVTSPNFATTATLPTLSVSDAYDYVIAHAGASLVRDELDSMVISQVSTLGKGTAGKTLLDANGKPTTGPSGGLYGSAASTGLTANNGLGDTAAGSRVVYAADGVTVQSITGDADKDGILDTWETAHGLNPNNAADNQTLNPLGYKMIEQYINELGSTNDSRAYTGGAVNAPEDYGLIRGTGTAAGNATLSSGTTNLLKLSVGGNGTAAGETMTVNGTGNLNVYDTIVVGDQNNAALNLAAGTVSAYNIVLGNTVYSPGAVTNVGTINFSGGTLNVSQLVLGGGTPGVWNAGGSMVWTGGTLKAAAILTVKAPISLGAAGGTFDTNGFDGTVSSVLSDVVGAHGAVTKLGVGTLTLGGTNTYTGVTKISAGSLAISALTNGGVAGNLGAASSAAANLVLDGGILKYAGAAATTTDRLFTMTAKGATIDAGTTGQVSFLGTGDVAQSGTGNRTLLLTGNTASSNFTLGLGDPTSGKTSLTVTGSGSSSARWLIGASSSPRTYSGDTTVTSGTLLTNANNVLPYGAGKGNLVITAGTVELNNNNLAVNGLSGTGTLNQRGSGSRTLTVGNGDATAVFAGTLSDNPLSTQGALALVKVGAGTQTLSGSASYEGATTVQAGTLRATATAYANMLTNAGGIDVQNGSMVFDYTGGASPQTTLRTLLSTGFTGSGLTAGQLRSTTATATRGLGYADDGVSTVTVKATLYGDADLDGGVSINDFNAVAANFGQGGKTWGQGDFDYDGGVSINDFNLMAANFGQTLGAGSDGPNYAAVPLIAFAIQHNDLAAFEAVTGVPEPTAGGLLVIGATLGLRRKRGA